MNNSVTSQRHARSDRATLRTLSGLPASHRRLVREIRAIYDLLYLDEEEILELPNLEEQWFYLVRARASLVRGQVVDAYAMIDDMLGSEIAAYFFRGVHFDRMWRTDKFRRFNYFILEKLSTRDKLALVKELLNMPKAIASRINAINAIRNEVAHALFPENLRAHSSRRSRKLAEPISCPYKGIDVFTAEGFHRFIDDVEEIRVYLRKNGKVYAKRLGSS